MKAPGVRPLDLVVAIGLAAASAAATLFALQSVARPSDFAGRLAGLQSRAAAAAGVLKTHSAAPSLPAGALCVMTPANAATKLAADVKAAGADLQFERFDVSATPQDGPDGGLTPVSVQLGVTGAYEADLTLLQRLSALRPVLLVDTADFIAKTSVVTLKLSGRVLCSAPR